MRIGLHAQAGLLALCWTFGAVPVGAAQETYDTSRVVAVGGSITEIVYALGEEERLVARDTTSIYPEEALDLPDVGYMRQLSPEGVLSVDPSLVIALEGSGPPEAVEVLQDASVPMVMVPERYDGEGIAEKIRAVGKALDVEDKAEALAEEVGASITAAAEGSRDADPKRVLFVLSMSGGRVMAAGTGTGADAMIAMAGGRNVISEYAGYKQLSDEALIEAAPEVILLMEREGVDDAQAEDLFAHPAIAPTPAGQNRQAIRMDGAYLLGFGPRTADAVRELAARLGEIGQEG